MKGTGDSVLLRLAPRLVLVPLICKRVRHDYHERAALLVLYP